MPRREQGDDDPEIREVGDLFGYFGVLLHGTIHGFVEARDPRYEKTMEVGRRWSEFGRKLGRYARSKD